MTDAQIGFIGAGKIGEPMVERLLAGGHPTTVYARRDEVRERLAARGAVLARTLSELGGSDVVVACLFDDSQLLEVAPEIIEAMSPGSIFMSHTTGSPDTIRRLETIGAPRGVRIVEAPFSGTPQVIRAGELTVLLAGAPDAVARAQSVVESYASRIHRTGALGSALSAKLLNNALFAACTQITLSALESARQLGIAEDVLLELLADSSGGSTAARYIAGSGQDALAYGQRISRYLTKDLAAARAAAGDLGVDIGALLAAARLGPMDLDEPVPTGV